MSSYSIGEVPKPCSVTTGPKSIFHTSLPWWSMAIRFSRDGSAQAT